jgi:hypothetical protein
VILSDFSGRCLRTIDNISSGLCLGHVGIGEDSLMYAQISGVLEMRAGSRFS